MSSSADWRTMSGALIVAPRLLVQTRVGFALTDRCELLLMNHAIFSNAQLDSTLQLIRRIAHRADDVGEKRLRPAVSRRTGQRHTRDALNVAAGTAREAMQRDRRLRLATARDDGETHGMETPLLRGRASHGIIIVQSRVSQD